MKIRSFMGWGSIAFALMITGCPKKDDKAEGKSEKASKDDEGDKKKSKKGDDEKYAMGDAVKFLPKECKGGRFYLNVALFLKSEAVEKAAESLEEKFSEKMMKKKKGSEQLSKALKSLKKSGIDPARDVKEVAFCLEPGMNQGTIAIGGNFAGKDPIGALAKAFEASASQKELEKKKADGIEYLKDDKTFFAAVAPNVVVVTEDKTQFADLKAGEGGAGFDTGKGRILSFFVNDKKNGKFTGSISEAGDDLDMKVVAEFSGSTGDKIDEDPKAFKTEFEKMRDDLETKLSKGPFKKIADDIGKAKIKVDGNKVTVTLSMPACDLGDSIKKAADMKDDELDNAVDL